MKKPEPLPPSSLVRASMLHHRCAGVFHDGTDRTGIAIEQTVVSVSFGRMGVGVL
jgi:hypothetical protein